MFWHDLSVFVLNLFLNSKTVYVINQKQKVKQNTLLVAKIQAIGFNRTLSTGRPDCHSQTAIRHWTPRQTKTQSLHSLKPFHFSIILVPMMMMTMMIFIIIVNITITTITSTIIMMIIIITTTILIIIIIVIVVILICIILSLWLAAILVQG